MSVLQVFSLLNGRGGGVSEIVSCMKWARRGSTGEWGGGGGGGGGATDPPPGLFKIYFNNNNDNKKRFYTFPFS